MVENKACFAIHQEVAEAVQAGNHRRAPERHRLERCQAERFPLLGDGRVDENAGLPADVLELRVADKPEPVDALAERGA
jgi:hypothetical protein